MRGACPAFHQTCNNCHKEEHFANVCMSTNKSLNYLGNHITPPATAGEALDEGNSSLMPFLIFQMKSKTNQPTNQHNRRGYKTPSGQSH